MNFKSLITSSANPKEISLTVKGLLTAIVPLIMVILGLPEESINSIIDGIVSIVYAGTLLISAVQVVYGLCRKIYLARWSAK